MFKINELIEAFNKLIVPPVGLHADNIFIDERTVRYYYGMELLDQPHRIGRDNYFSNDHLKKLLAIRTLQGKGYGLQQIRTVLAAKPLDDIFSGTHITDELIAAEVVRLDIPINLPETDDTEVYFALAAGTEKVKIASSGTPKKRVQEANLKLLGLMKGGRAAEIELHERFADEKMHGDWFRLSDRISKFILENCCDVAEAELAASGQQEIHTERIEMSKKETSPYATDKVSVIPNDQVKFQKISEKIKIGKAFVFLADLDDEPAGQLHRLIYGQRARRGKVKNAVIPARPDGFELPGCTVVGPELKGEFVSLVSDKDVYKEGVDVAQLFVFDPASPSETKKVAITSNGVLLDTLDAELDSNGCGTVRFAIMAAGQYEARVEGSEAFRRFEGTRYALAPLTATLARLTKTDIDGKTKFMANIEAMSFGQSFDGEAQVAVLADGTQIHAESVTFHEGMTSMSFEPAGNAALFLRVTSKADPDLVAAVPLPGSRKEEREDTAISRMGKIHSVSLVPSDKANCERGIYISENGISNTPISINSVVSKSIDLVINAAVTELTVIVREPISGIVSIHEIGSLKQGIKHKINFDSAMAQVHVGAFVDGKPWEGHAVVVRPSSTGIAISAPARVEPGKELVINLSTRRRASVLLRIADKRMRVQDGPLTASAAVLKKWVAIEMEKTKTGEVINSVVELSGIGPFGVSGAQGPSGPTWVGHPILRGGIVPHEPQYRLGLFGHGGGGGRANLMASNMNTNFQQEDAGDVGHVYFAASSSYGHGQDAHSLTAANYGEHMTFTSGVPEIAAAIASMDSSPAKQPAVPKKKIAARETEIDLIYWGLIEVNKKRTVKIMLPDSIGDYDISAFAVSGNDWDEAATSVVIDKDCYIEPMVPQFAHPEDEIEAMAVAVRAAENKFLVTVDGRIVEAKIEQEGKNVRISWPARPGLHEIVMQDKNGTELDRVGRLVEMPGEEVVIAQEIRILKPKEKYDINDDDGALSVCVIPGIQQELKTAVSVCADFSHSCSEQTSAKITAACLSALVGTTESEKEAAYQAIVRGEARLRSMYIQGRGFTGYPGGSITETWSRMAAHRMANLGMVAEGHLPKTAKKAIDSLISMGQDVLRAHGGGGSLGKMESIFYGTSNAAISVDNIRVAMDGLSGSIWNYQSKSEAAYCAAALIKANRLEDGIDVANAVAKAMGGTLGGAMHGSCECLAYMHMIHELRKKGIVPDGGGKAKINGNLMEVQKALGMRDISKVEATKTACAIRITRLSKIRFDEFAAGVQLTLDVEGKNGAKVLKAGGQVKVRVKIDDYRDGDVLCVALPECLSRITGGAKSRKFQLDFAGNKEMELDLVAGRSTKRPQRWAAVVRNMYDGARIGSVGLLQAMIE